MGSSFAFAQSALLARGKSLPNLHSLHCPSKCLAAAQIVNSRAFAAGRRSEGDPEGQPEDWKFCVPLLDMMDHGGPRRQQVPDEPVRVDNVRSASSNHPVCATILSNGQNATTEQTVEN